MPRLSTTIVVNAIDQLPEAVARREVACMPGSPVFHVLCTTGTECGLVRADCHRGGIEARYVIKAQNFRLCRDCSEAVA